MLAFLPLSAIIGYCFALKRFLTWPIEAIPFFVVSMFILILYFATFANHLSSVSLLLILTGNVLLISSPLYISKQKLWSEYLTPGIVVLIFFACVFGLITRHFLATDWDEIYIWLPHTRLLYLHHGFWNAADTIFNKDYPPGGALFHYLFLRLGNYSEGQIYFAHLTLFLIPTILLLHKYTWKNWQGALILFSVFLLILHFLFHIKMLVNESLLMDGIVAVFFGAILANYYILQNHKYVAAFLLAPASILVLLKPLTLPFLLIIVAIILVDQFLQSHKRKWLSICCYLVLLIFPFIVISLWQSYVTHYFMVNNKWSVSNLLITLKSATVTQSHLISTGLIDKYLSALILPTLFIVLMYVFLGFISCKIYNPVNKKRFWIAHTILILGYITYLLGLLFIYFFMMPDLMLQQMNSFVRFINIYCIAWLILALTHLLYSTEHITILDKTLQHIRSSFVAVFVILLGVPLFISLHVNHQRFVAKNNNQYIRYAIQQQLTDPLKHAIPANTAKIGIVWQGWGLMRFIIALELLPNNIYYLSSNSSLSQLQQVDYIISNKKLNISLKKAFFTQFELCADKNLDSVNTAHCTLHEVPFFIYKVM